MKIKHFYHINIALTLTVLSSCMILPVEKNGNDNTSNLTVGKVQSEIREGMPASRVAAALGAPNIVTTDEQRREVWIYDKVSSHRVDNSHFIGGSIVVFGGGTHSSESASNQKSLTIIVKYDEQNKVRDFAFNYTQF